MERRVQRVRGVRGLMALFNPRSVPVQVVQELEGFYGFQPREAGGCLADVMFSQRKGEFPPVAFALVHKGSLEATPTEIIDKILRVEKAFSNVFGIIVLPLPQHSSLQLELIRAPVRARVFTTSSLTAAVHLMASIHEKLSIEISTRAERLYEDMHNNFLTRQRAMQFLQLNLPFLKLDECDMLLDLFGSIGRIAQASASEILDVTVLDSASALAIEEFFKTEYAIE